MVDIVSERGYAGVTVRELARLAGVSTRTFYEHFDSKEDCLLRTFDQVVQRAMSHVVTAQKNEEDWQERLRLGFSAFAREIERKPQIARLAFIEALATGPPALQKMRAAEQAFEAMIEGGFAGAPDEVVIPPLVIEGIVAGVESVARARLLDDREQELPAIADEFFEWALCYRCEEAGLIPPGPRSERAALGKLAAAARPTTNGSVPGDERALIVFATASLAETEGYRELTIPRIRAAAGVSRKSFDTSFADVEECFVAALELHATSALSFASAAFTEARDWASGVHRGIVALCEYIARDPTLTALGFIEIFALGPEGMHIRERLTARATELFLESAPQDRRPDPLLAEASVGAVWGLLHHHIVAGRAQDLPRIAPTLSFMALTPTIGAAAALDAIGESAAGAYETSTTHRQTGRGAARSLGNEN